MVEVDLMSEKIRAQRQQEVVERRGQVSFLFAGGPFEIFSFCFSERRLIKWN